MKCIDSYLLLGIPDIDRNNGITEVLEEWGRTIILPADGGGLASVKS